MSEDSQPMDYTRQRDMFDPEKHENARVVMAGCGGIGSATALALTKLGIPNLGLIDPDKVELHNIPNQFFRTFDIGETKVAALQSMIYQLMGEETTVDTYPKLIQDVSKNQLKGVLVTGFDSMASRAEAWKLARYNSAIERLIDGRIGKEDIVIYSINPGDMDDIEYYESECLYSDDEAEELACTERAIIDVMFTVASLITRQVRRHFVGDSLERVTIFNQAKLEVLTV